MIKICSRMLKTARMYCKFLSNSHKQWVFTNITLFQLYAITWYTTNKNRLGKFSVIDKTTAPGAEDFSMKYFIWLYLRYFFLSVHDAKKYCIKLNYPIELHVLTTTHFQRCLTFSWIQLQTFLRCCLLHITIIIFFAV